MDTTARGDKKKLRACSPVWGGKQRARTPLSSTLPCPSQVKASWPRTAPASWERGAVGSPVWSNRQPPRCLPGAAPGLCKHSWEGPAGRARGRNAALPGEGPSLGFMGMAGVCGHGGWGGRKALWACLRAQVRSCLPKEYKRGVCWGHTEPPRAQELTSNEGQLLFTVPRGGHEHPAVTVLPWGCPPHPQLPALLHAPSPSTPPHSALHHQPSHYPSLRSVPSQNVPALSSPHPPHPSFCSCCCIPPQRCILASLPLQRDGEMPRNTCWRCRNLSPRPNRGA